MIMKKYRVCCDFKKSIIRSFSPSEKIKFLYSIYFKKIWIL